MVDVWVFFEGDKGVGWNFVVEVAQKVGLYVSCVGFQDYVKVVGDELFCCRRCGFSDIFRKMAVFVQKGRIEVGGDGGDGGCQFRKGREQFWQV